MCRQVSGATRSPERCFPGRPLRGRKPHGRAAAPAHAGKLSGKTRFTCAGLEASRGGDANSPSRQSCGARCVGRWWQFSPGEEREERLMEEVEAAAAAARCGCRCRVRIPVSVACWLFRSHGSTWRLSPPIKKITCRVTNGSYGSCGRRGENGRELGNAQPEEEGGGRGEDARTGCEGTREGWGVGKGEAGSCGASSSRLTFKVRRSAETRVLVFTCPAEQRPVVSKGGNQTFALVRVLKSLVLRVPLFLEHEAQWAVFVAHVCCPRAWVLLQVCTGKRVMRINPPDPGFRVPPSVETAVLQFGL